MYQRLAFPVLSQFDAETVHDRTTEIMAFTSRSIVWMKLLNKLLAYEHPSLRTNVFGLNFNNPLGLAAGFDKKGTTIPFVAALGFSHIDCGTFVPLAQSGNSRPRLFRLAQDHALVNRMGFNSPGIEKVKRNLERSLDQWIVPGFKVGINIGANKISVESGKAFEDYVVLAEDFGLTRFADFITINISSPNTAKLRDLQGKEALEALLIQILRAFAKVGYKIPILIKIAPDLSEKDLDDILGIIIYKVDGIVATNTTLDRPEYLPSKYRLQVGGLSGRPLLDPSTKIIRYIYQNTHGLIPIIGVGGVFDWSDVVFKIVNGASLVQTYAGFVYQGPTMPRDVKRGLVRYMKQEGVKNIRELVGSRT